jgi:hypothetical protein
MYVSKVVYFTVLSVWHLKEDEMGRKCGTYGEKRDAYRVW